MTANKRTAPHVLQKDHVLRKAAPADAAVHAGNAPTSNLAGAVRGAPASAVCRSNSSSSESSSESSDTVRIETVHAQGRGSGHASAFPPEQLGAALAGEVRRQLYRPLQMQVQVSFWSGQRRGRNSLYSLYYKLGGKQGMELTCCA
eukprot:scaffold255236_cov18-Tisochrysis_lutea.AAC.1